MMVNKYLLLSLLSLNLVAQPKELVVKTGEKSKVGKWYCDAQIGHGWTRCVGLGTNPNAVYWDNATEGYEGNLGRTGFIGLLVGRQMCNWSALEFEYNLFQTMNYQKYQTTSDSSTSSFTGNKRMRFFNVSHQSALFNFKMLLPKDWAITARGFRIEPTVGAGVGVGINNVSNFYTVGYNRLDDVAFSTSGTAITSTDSIYLGSTSSIALPAQHIGLAWQVNSGLMFQPENSETTFGLIYRYYEGGKFASDSKVMSNTVDGLGAQVYVAPWIGKIKMHQLIFKVECPF